MNHSTRRSGRRLFAGLAAVALGAVAALGVATPAMAAPNIDPTEPGSITVHKFEQPATPGTPNDGSAIDTTGLEPLAGVVFSAERVTSIDLSTNEGWVETDGLTAAAVLSDPVEYPLGTAVSRTTSAAGTAVFDGLELGVYLVRETSAGDNPVALPAQPFLVSIPMPIAGDDWLYDVHVYPKNALADISKTVDDDAAFGIGDAMSWTIATTIPFATEGNTLDSYVVTDDLDARLAYTGAVVSLGGAELVVDEDYTVTEVEGLLTFAFTTAGLATLNASGGETVSIDVTTDVIALGDGMIVNSADLFINDPLQENPFTSNDSTSYWGAVRIVKHAEGDAEALLDGAVFEVRNDDGDLVEVNGATRFTTVDGVLVIEGLRTSQLGETYTLTEVAAPTGYVLDPTPRQVTVTAGSAAEAVEVTIANTQVPPFQLPITGGDGQLAFMIGGGALLMIALGSVLVHLSRRRAATQQG